MIKITIVPHKEYEALMKGDNFSIIHDVLRSLSVETETQALELSLLKWKILSENKNLSSKDMYYIGANTMSCGLCRLYEYDCLECYKFTGFKMDKKKVCFREYDDWLSKVSNSFMTPKSAMRKKAQRVHDVLYDCYKKHAELK